MRLQTWLIPSWIIKEMVVWRFLQLSWTTCNSIVFREKELDLRVGRVTDAEKKVTRCVFVNVQIFGDVLVLILWSVPVKQLFVSEASTYRKQPRDGIFRLDTAEPPEGLLQYRTDPLSPSRYALIHTSRVHTHKHTYSHMLYFKLTNMFLSTGCLLSPLTPHIIPRLQIMTLRVCWAPAEPVRHTYDPTDFIKYKFTCNEDEHGFVL